MSLGITSICKSRSRCTGTLGFAAFSRCAWRSDAQGLPAKAGYEWRRFQSTAESASPSSAQNDNDEGSSGSMGLVEKPKARLVRTNHERNRMYRSFFKAEGPEIREEVEKKTRTSPYVPTAKRYPSDAATESSSKETNAAARVQVGHGLLWRSLGSWIPQAVSTYSLLRKMTMKKNDASKTEMAAMRIVLPKSWDLDVENRKVVFVESATGLAAKLRLSADHRNPSAIIIRGRSSTLAKAADELVAACKEVEVYKLGDVAAFGYEEKRLWPAIEDAPDGGSVLPEDKLDNIWVHKERPVYWIDWPYEKTPKPKEWTTESFENYITSLVCGRLRPHLATKFYKQNTLHGGLIDTDGIRVKMVAQAFADPVAKPFITPSALKLALAFMAQRGGHRAAADKLLTMAEEWGMPMDTDMFNIMLESYLSKRDSIHFHKLLLKMSSRYFHPNARTWLLYLELVKKEIERRQIIVSMYDLGLFEDPATRRGIAKVMASNDAYMAFRAGKRLELFLVEQVKRYGEDWFTTAALNDILTEFFRFHPLEHRRFDDFKFLLDRPSEDGRKIDISTVNAVLAFCIPSRDFQTALWILSRLPEYECVADHRTYELLVHLFIRGNSPHALGVTLFYAALDYMLKGKVRPQVSRLLLGHSKNSFWQRNQPKVMTSDMARHLAEAKVTHVNYALSAVEHAVQTFCQGARPVKPLHLALDVALRTMDSPLHSQLAKTASRKGDGDGEGEKDRDGTVSHRPVEVGNMAIKLRLPGVRQDDSTSGSFTVHLNSTFQPKTMMENWGKTERRLAKEVVTRPVVPA